MERMIKVQDVLLKAMAKKISWVAAAEIIRFTPRTMRRWRDRLEQDGYKGLADRRKGKVSYRRVTAGKPIDRTRSPCGPTGVSSAVEYIHCPLTGHLPRDPVVFG
jgi:hypothetical protein